MFNKYLWLLFLPLTVFAESSETFGDFGGLHLGRLNQDLAKLHSSSPRLADLAEDPWLAGFHVFNNSGGAIVGFKGDLGWSKDSDPLIDIKRLQADFFLHMGKAFDMGSLYHLWGSGGIGWLHSRITLLEQPARQSWPDALDGSFSQSVLSLSGPAWEALLGADIRTQIPNMDTGAWLTLGFLVSYKEHFSKDNWKINGSDELREAPETNVGGLSINLTIGYRY